MTDPRQSEATQTTLEQASRCPKCDEPGNFVGERPLTSIKGKLKMFRCENKRCKWFETEWPVQVSSNGTIPLTLRRPKQFTALPDDKGKTMEALERQLGLETKSGAELNNRYR